MPEEFSADKHWVTTPFEGWSNKFAVALHPATDLRHFLGQPTTELLWRLIEKYSEVRSVAIRRFKGTEDQKVQLWSALRGLVIQAREYFRAAEATSVPSAALLYYYCFLNLAKAEILLWRPELIFDRDTGAVKRLDHGLSADPTKATNFEEDSLKVLTRGVFPLLYEMRLGQAPQMSEVGVVKLLQHVPELGTDLEDVSLPSSLCGFIRTAVINRSVEGRHELRTVCAIRFPWGLQDVPTALYIRRHFQPVKFTQPEADALFNLKGWDAIHAVFFESKEPRSVTSTSLYVHEADEVLVPAFHYLQEILDIHPQTGEFYFCTPSLTPDAMVPLTPALASYALMYYVSSVVRYKPYQLYSEANGLERWILNAYVTQAPQRLLFSALNGISAQQNLFSPA